MVRNRISHMVPAGILALSLLQLGHAKPAVTVQSSLQRDPLSAALSIRGGYSSSSSSRRRVRIRSPKTRWSSSTTARPSSISLPVVDTEEAPLFFRPPRRRLASPTVLGREASTLALPTAAHERVGTSYSKLDICLFLTYFCNMLVINLPTVALSPIAMEFTASPAAAAQFVAGAAAMAPLGGFVGKLINGFVSQGLGGRSSSFLYLGLLSATSWALSFVNQASVFPWMLTAFEFWSSIQWISLAQILTSAYAGKEPEKLSRGIASMGVASVTGALVSKTVGAWLMEATHSWRMVCRFGSLVAALGAASMFLGIDAERKTVAVQSSNDAGPAIQESAKVAKSNPWQMLKPILTSPIFWMFGAAHCLGYIARGSDRLLGTFMQSASALPGSVCASLTSCVTLGMFFGLVRGRKFDTLSVLKEKKAFLARKYRNGALCTLGLAFAGLPAVGALLGSWTTAAWIAACSFGMASSVSFPFYQFPNMVSNTMFAAQASIALALVDAIGFLGNSQVVALQGRLLQWGGWPLAWGGLALLFGGLGKLFVSAVLPTVVQRQEETAEVQRSESSPPSSAKTSASGAVI